MKFLIIIFIFIFNCTAFQGEKTKKIYICGDHPCANKKKLEVILITIYLLKCIQLLQKKIIKKSLI